MQRFKYYKQHVFGKKTQAKSKLMLENHKISDQTYTASGTETKKQEKEKQRKHQDVCFSNYSYTHFIIIVILKNEYMSNYWNVQLKMWNSSLID